MVRCVAIGCDSDSSTTPKDKKLAFFSFPKNPGFREAWVRAIGLDNFTPTRSTLLCSKHFTEDQYISLATCLRRRDGAIPTIFPDTRAKSKSSTKPANKDERTPERRKGTEFVKVLASEPDTIEAQESESSTPPDSVTAEQPGSCFVPHCNAKGSYKFSVPKDAELRKNWETTIGRMDGREMTEDDVVCELHFLKPMIKMSYVKKEGDVFHGVKTLTDDALPVVLHGFAKPTKSANTSKGTSSSTPLPSTSRQEASTSTKKKIGPIKRKCCVPSCSSFESPWNSFHHFPDQKARRRTWLQLLNMKGFIPNKQTRVCCKHFTSSCFTNPGVLRIDAVPKPYTLPRKIKLESEEDTILSEVASKKRVKIPNPWGVKGCDVVVSKEERKLADEALSRCDYDPISWLRSLDVPMPMVEVKEEDPEVMDLTIDEPMDTDPMPPSPVRPLAPPITTPRPIQPKPEAPPLVIPPVLTSNNLMFQTTLRSASEVKKAQDQPLPPSTIYRVIIPTSVQGHTIEPNSILQQLKEKISAMHQENVIKNLAATTPVQVPVSTPPKPFPATLPHPTPTTSKNALSTPKTKSSTQNMLKTAMAQNSATKTSKLTLVDNTSGSPPADDDHAYATQPNTTSWPILIQNQIPSVLPTPTDIKLVASTSSAPVTLSQSHPVTNSTQKPLASTPSTSTVKLVQNTPSNPPLSLVKVPALNIQSLSPSVAFNSQGGMMKMVPNNSAGTSYVGVKGPGGRPASYMPVRSLTVGTQTTVAINPDINTNKAARAIRNNEENRKALKRLRQSLKRYQERLLKTTKELEDLKSMKALFLDMEKGLDNVIIVETADECMCYTKRREHEDVGDLLKYAVQKKIPPPAESKALVTENEKLMKRIELIKRRLQKKDILKVVVLQTEDMLPFL
uniref:THAP domain-containing protein 2 n=1 Tax=Lygus hesperus TaxID=30085 RepID=A0A0A9YKM1_LYGHE